MRVLIYFLKSYWSQKFEWYINAPHSAPFPAVLYSSSIKGQFHVQISKIM